jgi:hypothetical protein
MKCSPFMHVLTLTTSMTQCDVQKQMWLFIRDDFMTWFKAQARDPASNERLEFRVSVAESIERIIKRMSQLSASGERGKVGIPCWSTFACSDLFLGSGG